MSGAQLSDSARYEVKFSTNSAHYDFLKQWLSIHPMCFSSPFPSRRINNIYFDTFDLDSYLENMAGISSRTKLRLRWYGETKNIQNPTLELKIKRNKLGWKKSSKIELDESIEGLTIDSIREAIYQASDSDLCSRFRQSDHAILLNTYERDYFQSQDGRVRITIDSNLKFFDQRLHQTPNLIFPGNVPEIVILEVKVASEDYDLAGKFLESAPNPPTRSSKYVIGVQSILGY